MRRFIIKGLDSQANLEEDVARNKNQFKVLFKLLHVNEYDHITTDQLQDVVRKLRNNERLDTYYSKVEKAFENEDIKTAIRLLKSRPGEFVKNINRLMSLKFEKEKDVKDIYKALLSACRETFPKTRPEDLCRLIQYMNSRMREYKMNVHNVKGRMILDDKHVLHALNSDLAGKIINEAKSAIASQLAADKDYGKVYIEDNMYKMVVPANMKDMSEASNTYTRGSRIPIEKDEDGNVKNIRFSIWWTNTMEERVDMDLSAKYHKFRDMVDENEKHTMFVDEACDNPQVLGVSGGLSYASTFKDTGCYHSGDITNGGDYNGVGATEYIDIDITALKEDGVKFVQFYINSYEGQPFDTVDHCEFAIQERNELTMSQQFDIKAVKQHAKLTSKTCGCIPCVLDVENGELIWTDTAEYHVKRLSNVFSKGISTGFQVLMDDVYYNDRLSMGELAKIAVGANNGVFVDNPKEADTLFMVDNYDEKTKGQRIITSKDIDVWLGEFMSPQNQEEYPDEPEKEISSDECATSIIDAADKGILDDLLDDEENLLSEAGDEQTK